jgi:uncharacterized OB-fold protein
VSAEPRRRLPAIEGWFTLEDPPHLLGSRCRRCGSYFFPRLSGFCRNPDCESVEFEAVELSRTGRLWSYTNACYQPPAPYVSAEPFVPFGIAAVELPAERLIVLGQLAAGVELSRLRIGMPVELVLESLYREADGERLVWKWRPLGEPT